MNTTFKKYNLRFTTKNDYICILGTEKDKRTLLSNVIFEETTNKILDTTILKESFNENHIEKISKIINQFFNKKEFSLNNFSSMNLLLHFLIIIDRVKKGYSLSNVQDIVTENNNELDLIGDLSKRIEEVFSIKLNVHERNEIYILFKTNVNYHIDSNLIKFKKFIGPKYLDSIYQIIDEVSDVYSINLHNETFIVPFGLHLKSLITRVSLKKYNKNPFLATLKRDCPIIFDIAIFVSLRLSEIYDIDITQDEIAFIAIHIGSEIDRQKSDTDKLKCVLICPNYLNLETKIYNELISEFSDEITIIEILSNYVELDNYTFDLLISTLDDERNSYYPNLVISPFHIENQKKKIQKVILEIQQNQKRDTLYSNFEDYFGKELFFTIDKISKNQAIDLLCDEMAALQFIPDSFKEDVYKREDASSTAFGNIAIPHSVHMNALKTNIGIIISKSGIKWNGNIVHVVLLIAINKHDKDIFLKIYESLLSMFDNPNIIEILKNVTSLNEFKNVVFANV
ncbi:PTS sugar transporter subunit IIA [Salipaludibacillus sp. LMS25]|jgi:lichenan operon transcriptional antiterminator|uniref:BglG family transcription antiterminator n=1 Tax=Salipaludibacillus sp. LMS25 TaxID=2924031 RepID=UPI0020D0C2E7|nr:PTS sugar transporter subunit IIA [Salipaludibacillus sp. LMS25]UTR13724.1 PTS sugar transporter subunit IIA [Salipaludibacillus sp. LMS25]